MGKTSRFVVNNVSFGSKRSLLCVKGLLSTLPEQNQTAFARLSRARQVGSRRYKSPASAQLVTMCSSLDTHVTLSTNEGAEHKVLSRY